MTVDLAKLIEQLREKSTWRMDIHGELHFEAAEALSRLSVERDELKAEAARLRTIICASAAAIGNGSVLSPECSIDFMEILPEEIAKHTDKLRRFLKCSRDEGGEALARAETAERALAALSRERLALFKCAASCQGGHSDAGDAAADALGIPFPITMSNLISKAREEGLNPRDVWPWAYRSLNSPGGA